MIGKCENSLALLLGDGKQIFQDVAASLSQATLEVVEDEMRIGLTDGADVGDVVSGSKFSCSEMRFSKEGLTS